METNQKPDQKFKPRVVSIKGLSERRRLPRLGIIRLGLKAKSKKSGKEYPVETEYFVCPPEVEQKFGAKPKELEVMLPLNSLESVFPTAYKWYGSTRGLKCTGDGVVAWRYNDEKKEQEQRVCPCELLEQDKCKPAGTLMVIIPKISMGGIYQIRTGSINSIIDINSGIDYVASLLDGRFALVPLMLRRQKIETYHDDKKSAHYTLQIIFDADPTTVAFYRENARAIINNPRYQLPEPKDENPALDAVDVVVDDEEAGATIDVTVDIGAGTPGTGSPSSEPAKPTHDVASGSLFNDVNDVSFKKETIIIDFTKKKACKGYDLGEAVKCPNRPEGDQAIRKALCNECASNAGCPAWTEEKI